jgi:hypothetical protein
MVGLKAADRIVLLPAFDMCRLHGENVSLTGPLSGKVFITGSVAPEAADFVSDQFKKRLSRIEQIELIEPSKQDHGNMAGIDPVAGQRNERIAAIQQLGREHKAEGVFCAYVYAFRERVGTAYGVDQPAKVTFELNLVSVATGAIVWQAHFSETQKTLSENALLIGKFLKRKGRWITAKEMTAAAMEERLQVFENDYVRFPQGGQ